MSRTQLRIKDTGLAQPSEIVGIRDVVASGAWLELYGSTISYNIAARIGMKEEFALEDNNDLNSPFTFNDVNHYGVNFPIITITGSLDTDIAEHQTFIQNIHDLVKTQGLKQIEGDFLSYIGTTIYGRVMDVTFNPPRYAQAVNRLDYQIKFVRVQ